MRWTFRDKSRWQLWFAWHPVKMGHRHWAWLEKVQRHRPYEYPFNYWVYRWPMGRKET